MFVCLVPNKPIFNLLFFSPQIPTYQHCMIKAKTNIFITLFPSIKTTSLYLGGEKARCLSGELWSISQSKNIMLSPHLWDLRELLRVLIHTSLKQHIVHHPHQLDHFLSAAGLPKHTTHIHSHVFLTTFILLPEDNKCQEIRLVVLFGLTVMERPAASAPHPAAGRWTHWGTHTTGQRAVTLTTKEKADYEEGSRQDSLLVELQTPQPFVPHNMIFFRHQTLWNTGALKDSQSLWQRCFCWKVYRRSK